jgi:hypothetical protein
MLSDAETIVRIIATVITVIIAVLTYRLKQK